MADFDYPLLTRAPSMFEMGPRANTQVFTSSMNGSVQTLELPGVRWIINMTYDTMEQADAALLQAHIMKLRGQANRTKLWAVDRPIPRGTMAGTPLVKGATQSGASLLIDGVTAGKTMLIGDYFSVGGELKMVVADALADGSGNMTLTFEPPLRVSPADNASIVFNKPTARFILAEPETRWQVRAPIQTGLSLAFVEMF